MHEMDGEGELAQGREQDFQDHDEILQFLFPLANDAREPAGSWSTLVTTHDRQFPPSDGPSEA